MQAWAGARSLYQIKDENVRAREGKSGAASRNAERRADAEKSEEQLDTAPSTLSGRSRQIS